MKEFTSILCGGSKASLTFTAGVILGMSIMFGIMFDQLTSCRRQLHVAITAVNCADSIMERNNIWDADDSQTMQLYCELIDSLNTNK